MDMYQIKPALEALWISFKTRFVTLTRLKAVYMLHVFYVYV